MWTPRDYASLARAGFERNVIAYRCVRLVSEAAASIPLKVTDGGAAASEHPLLSLLQHPNPEQSGAELLETLYGFLQTAGNAYPSKRSRSTAMCANSMRSAPTA
ncbi:MAG: phage portal protein [Parvularculaceae bacterium]